MEAFPAFFPLRGRRVVVAGEGEGAEAKVRLLAGSPAVLARLKSHEALKAENYAGAALAFIAGAEEPFREQAAAAARSAGVPVNVVDDPERSDFHTPAIIDRGQVVAAVGTAGAAPMLAALVRADLEASIPESLGALAELLGRFRADLRVAYPDLAQRRAFLRRVLDGPVAEAAKTGDLKAAARGLRAAIDERAASAGKIWLIEAPAARDLLSLRAARALALADLLVLDDGVEPGVASLARRDATWRSLNDTDDEALVEAFRQGWQVVVVARAASLAGRATALAALGIASEVLVPAANG